MIADQRGFTLVELLVVFSLFSVLSVGFYSVMFSGTDGSETATSLVQVSEEARLGFNRMVRDTREATSLESASATGYNVHVDFDGDRLIALRPSPNPAGDFEDVEFTWNESARTVVLNGEVLVENVDCIRAGGVCTTDVFSYASNLLDFDWNSDGLTTWQELDLAGCAAQGSYSVGNCQSPPVLDVERPFLSSVRYAFRVTVAGRSADFYGEAQMRNRR